MIDVCQWRESIGVWCCHRALCDRGSAKTRPTTSRMCIGVKVSAVAIALSLLIALSGDIEPNPGPKTGIKSL